MTVVDFHPQRRRHRSGEALTAITYQLEHIFAHQELSHFVLGDSRGLRVASAGDPDQSAALAAYAPMLATHRGKSQGKVHAKIAALVPHFNPAAMSIRTFEIDGETLFLVSVGEESGARQASLYRAVTGIRRILKQTAAAA